MSNASSTKTLYVFLWEAHTVYEWEDVTVLVA